MKFALLLLPGLFKVNHHYSNMAYYADPLVAGSAHRPQPRPRLLSRWNDFFTSSPVYVVLELLAGIPLNATTVVYVSLKIKSISNLAKTKVAN